MLVWIVLTYYGRERMEIRYSTASEKIDAVQKYVIQVKEWLNEDCIDKGSYDQIEKLTKALKLIKILRREDRINNIE